MSQNNIPSKENFLRAKAAMRKDDHGLSEVRERILAQLKSKGLHEFMVLYSRKTDTFGAYVFYEMDNQISEAAESGLSGEIKSLVIDELERVGRGSKESIKINFEFDSHENVLKNYEGDYYNRLR
ncbi:hypothetical protein EZI54_23480 [Marinobacter halodurans]|uniref:Uncharacterized protein n=1 Tax=Marinobacter halodurans TaxID=2528979 RepID=A0ABY1ZH42_9GAMM|nr:hypothetical protein [Marinobacter halodurans]TBW45607.1 hypothetical protein EZI54_23480 [Marinobacter halodurans]